jgi:serine/threonine protein phosphatase PrpC
MTRGVQVAVASGTDVGRVRAANEDALWTGDSVFAVADGMGGHAAGEVASATALGPVAELDGKVFADARSARKALAEAVLHANVAVVTKAENDPTFRGMGTTLTAAMVEGKRLHVAHVGDSRAYLLRNGELSQLTTDHTLVQHLIDEGELTPEQAAEHPQRSVITRAIGVSNEVEVDSLSIHLAADDQLLLCSDGLTGVVTDAEIARYLIRETDASQAVARLIAAANAAGGPDNITLVLLRFGALDDSPAPPDADHTGILQLAGSPIVVRPDHASGEDDWAEQLGRYGAQADDSDDDLGRVSRAQRITAIAVATTLLLVMALVGGRWLLSRSYYVGAEGDRIAIFQGVPATLGPIDFSWVVQETDLTLSDVPDFFQRRLREGIAALDLTDAQRIVDSAPRSLPTPDPGATQSPSSGETQEPRPSP